jgi:hypothetical protein
MKKKKTINNQTKSKVLIDPERFIIDKSCQLLALQIDDQIMNEDFKRRFQIKVKE